MKAVDDRRDCTNSFFPCVPYCVLVGSGQRMRRIESLFARLFLFLPYLPLTVGFVSRDTHRVIEKNGFLKLNNAVGVVGTIRVS